MTSTMKRRLASRAPWPRVLERRFTMQVLDQPDFTGHVTLLCIDAVREPLWVAWQAQHFCIVDAGYTWLQQFPTGAHHAVTTQFDAAGQVVQWYIDLCWQLGVDEAGVPWWDDLFLDVLVFPTGGCYIVDEDELEDAWQSGVINETQYQLAWNEARRLVQAIEQNNFPLLALSQPQRALLLATL